METLALRSCFFRGGALTLIPITWGHPVTIPLWPILWMLLPLLLLIWLLVRRDRFRAAGCLAWLILLGIYIAGFHWHWIHAVLAWIVVAGCGWFLVVAPHKDDFKE